MDMMLKFNELTKIGVQIVVGDTAKCDDIVAKIHYGDIAFHQSNKEHYDECYIVSFTNRVNSSGMQPVPDGVNVVLVHDDASELEILANKMIWSACTGILWRPSMTQGLIANSN